MNYTYLLGGMASIGFGGWLIFNQIKIFVRGKQDKLGWDIKLLSGGILCLMLGIYLLTHFASVSK